jgi:hypothetical protein
VASIHLKEFTPRTSVATLECLQNVIEWRVMSSRKDDRNVQRCRERSDFCCYTYRGAMLPMVARLTHTCTVLRGIMTCPTTYRASWDLLLPVASRCSKPDFGASNCRLDIQLALFLREQSQKASNTSPGNVVLPTSSGCHSTASTSGAPIFSQSFASTKLDA